METHTYNHNHLGIAAQNITFTTLLNSYCREFTNWNRYFGSPKHDPILKDFIDTTESDFFLIIDFKDQGSEVIAPLVYFSETGIHTYAFPIIERNIETNVIKIIDSFRFLSLATVFAKKEFPNADEVFTASLLKNSISNLTSFLGYQQEKKISINDADMSFIAAEQSLILGHSMHPLSKTREGFTNEDLIKYSPETKGEFQLHYFLIHPKNVEENNAEGDLVSKELKKSLLKIATNTIKSLIEKNPTWVIVPTHPWEAKYLLNKEKVIALKNEGQLHNLGQMGSYFSATSSVRTVYNETDDWMYKFSLHVKITNSYRVNYAHELYRGYEASQLLQTPWGETLKEQHPEVNFITDPGYIIVRYKDEPINGFNLSIRKNPFKKDCKKKVSLLAGISQDSILGAPSRVTNILKEAQKASGKTLEEITKIWLTHYFNVGIKPLLSIFNKYGFGSEFHQQNVILELGDDFLPKSIYFRDNQAFFFREERKEELQKILPSFGAKGTPFIPKDRMRRYWDYYVLSNNFFGIINALGKTGFTTEKELLSIAYDCFAAIESSDNTGYIHHFLNSSKLGVKGNLLTNLNRIDEATASRANPATYRTYYNPLNYKHYCPSLLAPTSKEALYSRYFPKEDVTISIRPFNIDCDLDLFHEWFHREHTKNIWQMNWSLKKLEAYYRIMLGNQYMYSYVGEANGVPTCNFEVYWPIRDLIGDYYDVHTTDYGTHQMIAETNPKKKYVSLFTQCMVDFVFAEDTVGKMVGEGSVDSRAAIINKAHVGFRIEKVIEMPHKRANLNFCYREWYWAKFPQNKNISLNQKSNEQTENLV